MQSSRVALAAPAVSFWNSLLESRPGVQAIFAVRYVVGAGAGAGNRSHLVLARGFEGAAAWLAATMFIYLLNGLSDVAGDRVNGSSRPLARGALDVRAAAAWCGLLAVGSGFLAERVGLWFEVLDLVMLSLGLAYSLGPLAAKNSAWSASVVIGIGGLATYVAGMLAADGRVTLRGMAIAGVMAAWMAAAGNTKDFGDLDGDRAAGRRTLPVLLGRRRATRVIVVLAGLVALIGVAAALWDFRLWPLALLAPYFAAVACVARLRRKPVKLYRYFVASQWLVNVLVLASISF